MTRPATHAEIEAAVRAATPSPFQVMDFMIDPFESIRAAHADALERSLTALMRTGSRAEAKDCLRTLSQILSMPEGVILSRFRAIATDPVDILRLRDL